MKTIIKKIGRKGILRTWALLFLFTMIVSASLGEPIKAQNAFPASKEDEKAAIEETKHQEFMNYVYMALGLGVIFGVAWFTVAGKRKKNDKAKSEKSNVIKHQHSNYYKRYGSSRSHGIRH